MIKNLNHLRKARNLYNLMRSQWKSNEELKILQEKRLRSVIKYSYENISLFNSKCKKAGVRPEDIKTVEDLVKVPFTTKAEIQAHYPHGVVARHIDLSKCWVSRTSGSTGNPLTMVYDAPAEDFEKATALRPNLSCGQKLWSKWAVITSPDHMIKMKWFQKLRLFRTDFVSLYVPPEEQVCRLQNLNIDVLDGYASSIYLIAREILRSGEIGVTPKLVFTTAEVLTDDMRDVIDSAFGLKCLDQFGCVEVGRTAWECMEHTGYHIDMESVVIEFISEGEQVISDESGEIVYTSLYNYAMPLIRYRVGDMGVPTDELCSCGRGLSLMKGIEGRKDAFIKNPSGRIFSPIIWTILLRPYNITQFQVIQERIDKIKILIVTDISFDEERSNLKTEIENVLGDEIEIDINVVEEILREKSGKISSVISKIKNNLK